MNLKLAAFFCFIILFGSSQIIVCISEAGTVYEGRDLKILPGGKPVFSVAVTHVDSGHNLFPIRENVASTKVPLAEFGSYEVLHPLNVNNNHPIVRIENKSLTKFRIEFRHDEEASNLTYRVKSGDITIRVDNSEYYPVLIISPRQEVSHGTKLYVGSNQRLPQGKVIQVLYDGMIHEVRKDNNGRLYVTVSDTVVDEDKLKLIINKFKYDCRLVAGTRVLFKRKEAFIFYDFNHPLGFLRRYFGQIERKKNDASYYHFFYFYESDSYSNSDFVVYQDTNKVNPEKMGLSTEYGDRDDVSYYLRVVENLLLVFGRDFAHDMDIIMVTRYGKELSSELARRLREAGVRANIRFLAYSDL